MSDLEPAWTGAPLPRRGLTPVPDHVVYLTFVELLLRQT